MSCSQLLFFYEYEAKQNTVGGVDTRTVAPRGGHAHNQTARQSCTFSCKPIADTESNAIMDYEGQKLAELLFYWIILSFGAVGWVIGYVQQDFLVVFYAWLVGVVLSVIVRLEYKN